MFTLLLALACSTPEATKPAAEAEKPAAAAPAAEAPPAQEVASPAGAASVMNADVEAQVKRNSARIKSCVDQAVKGQPTLSGAIAAGWQVTAGKVEGVKITKNETKDSALEACVVEAVGQFTFDPTTTATVDAYEWRVTPS